MEKTMDKIVQVAKARGFVYPGSEIFGGLHPLCGIGVMSLIAVISRPHP